MVGEIAEELATAAAHEGEWIARHLGQLSGHLVRRVLELRLVVERQRAGQPGRAIRAGVTRCERKNASAGEPPVHGWTVGANRVRSFAVV
jgi:hypothetical protein